MPKDIIKRMINLIGDDYEREGLLDTPKRIMKSWDQIYSGYKFTEMDIQKMLTTFSAEQYDQMVLLKNIEFYSMCEHHMLPFFGKAHIAYVPSKNVVGISKLARLLEIFSRRLQIQERIGQQITNVLDKYLKPLGTACVLEAQHTCMTMRGVEKQSSVMVTSSITGIFKDSIQTKNEFLRLIK